ncbi:hypothetical protein GLA29479_4267 [Lysobacter antibioticus]|nr:hypothetical protein GLA29479_4267 [Lysobacter antibioticus]
MRGLFYWFASCAVLQESPAFSESVDECAEVRESSRDERGWNESRIRRMPIGAGLGEG